MPMDVFQLGLHLWYASYSHLSAISRICPPTACQVMIYHTLFNGSVGFHRDIGLRNLDGSQGQLGYSEDENSQVRGSSVLLYSIGVPMLFRFKKPPKGKDKHETSKKDYVTDDKHLSILMEDDSLLVLDPRDDERYVHRTAFRAKDNPMKVPCIRLVYVFRWLSKKHQFTLIPVRGLLWCILHQSNKNPKKKIE